jgi:hypothetical protein
MIDGTAWARPPTWIDRQRRLIRNTYHHATDQARHLGTQLRLNLTDTPGSNQSTTPASAPDDPSPDKPEQTTLRPRPDDSPPGEPDREAETPLDDTD